MVSNAAFEYTGTGKGQQTFDGLQPCLYYYLSTLCI